MTLESSEFLTSDDFYNREDFMYFQEKSRSEDLTRSEVTSILAHTANGRSLSILDTPCGFGRHSIEFASRGHMVIGLDKSEVFLNRASRHISRGHVTFLREELDTIIGEEKFDLIVNLFNSFGYFDHYRNLRFLERCYSQLKSGGALVIDTINGARLSESGFLEPVTLRREDNTLNITKNIQADDDLGQNIEYTMASSLDGRRCHTNFNIRFYTPPLLESMLIKCGFKTVQKYNSLSEMRDFANDSKYMVLVALK